MATELEKFVADPRYASLTPEQRADAFSKLEPRFGQLPSEEQSKFIGMAEQRWRVPVGSEQTGTPGPLNVRPAVEEVANPGVGERVADATLGAIGRGAIRTGEGVGGVMRYAGMEKAGKAVADTAARYSKPPKWIEEMGADPNRLTDPGFIANLAFEGVGSSVPFMAGGLGAAAGVARLPVGVWGTAAKWAAGTATGAVMESLVDAGSAFNEAIDVHKATPEAAAAVFAETVKREIPVTLLTNALGEFAPRLGGSIWKRALQVGLDATMEGVEEVAQGVAQRSAKNAALGTNTPLMEGAPEEFIGGALGGGIMSGVRALDARINAEPAQTGQQEQDVSALDPEVLPAGEGQRALPKPTPQRPIRGDLPPGQYEMGAARGNPNPVGEQGPFAMPGDAPVVDAEYEMVPPRQIEGREQARLMSPQVRGPRGNENPIGEQGPFEMGGVTEGNSQESEGKSDPWESFTDDMIQNGVNVAHMAASFQKNFGLNLEKEVREGRFGTNKIGVDELKGLRQRFPQKGQPKPKKGPEVDLESQLAASLQEKGIELPAVPAIDGGKPELAPATDAATSDARYRKIGKGEKIDGRVVRGHISNTSSIAASFDEYEELQGIREISLDDFEAPPERTKRTLALAEEIRQSGEIEPLIVAIDSKGPYILEGGHRYDALKILGARSFPALVVVDHTGRKPVASTPVETPTTPVEMKAPVAEPEAKTPEVDDDAPKLHIPREQNSVVASVMSELNYGGHSANDGGKVIDLERIAQDAYGGKRTEGKFTKRQIYEAQEAGMNAWQRDNSTQIMRMEPKKAIALLRGKTKRLSTQTVRDDEQVRKQQFSTPPALAYLAQKVAAVTAEDSVLEPSGGTGGLVALVLPVAKSVHLNEIDPERAALARQIGFENQSAHDGEVINALLPADVKPSVVIMNPPFSSKAENYGGGVVNKNRSMFGYNHVEQALQRLAPGGRLVAILSGGMQGRDQGARLTAPQAAKFWQRMAKQYNIRANVGIPGKEYSKYGTSFPTQLVVIDKNGPTPGGNWLAQVAQAVKGDFESIEAAWDALADIAADRGTVGKDAAASGQQEPGTGVAAVRGGVQQSGGKRAGDAGVDRPAAGVRPGDGASRPDPEVRSGDEAQPDRAGEPGPRPAEAGQPSGGGDRQSPDERDPGLAGAAGLTPEQLIAQVTANIDAKRNPKPKNKLQQKAADAKAKKQTQPKVKGPASNPLKEQADAARDRLRQKMRGTQLSSGIDPQDLVDIATIGAEKMLDGAIKFDAWAKSMREDVGDLIDWMAQTTKQTADKVLRQIHGYAKQVAKNFGVEAEDAPAEEEPEGDVGIKRRAKANAQEDAGAFVIYEPTLEGGAHPGAIVESKSMATVSLPPLTYEPKLPAGTKISAVQLESVVIAGQQNERRNGDGSRGAALIGDGTGVGKGRTVAAMVMDNWNHGRKRVVWVSEKWDLIEDAKRDLAGIGAKHLAEKVVGLNKLDNKGTIELSEGVVFATYDLLRSKDKKGNTTIATLEQWLKGKDEAEGAFVAFDEAHEMKNTVPAGRAQASQMGVAAKKLRDALPNLRTVYMSATSATEVENMGYLERLGLWGSRTPFPNGFAQFVNEVGSGGIATMELIARELKATGKYIARTLSYKGVKYDNVEAELNPDQREIYRKAAGAWRMVTGRVEKAVETVNGGREARSNFMSQYWSANQRFYNLLLTALKVPAAIELAERGLAQDKSIVITLQNTNEAAQNRQEAKLKGEEDDGDPDDLDFGPKDILINLVMEHYPTQQWVDVVEIGLDGKEKVTKKLLTRKDESGKDVPVLNPQAIAERDALVKELERDLHMPANPLDILIEHFGRDNVAELTGRSKYYDAATGKFEKRGGDLPRKKVNIAAAQDFQDGTKRVAILSQAAGTGISLHASNDAKNQQQRWHITLQAGWSADKAMQMLGRTHRTNQKHTPHYFTLVSDMSGEKRFLATIAKRMGSLGALTRGSAEATGGADMSNVNYESTQGQQAAETFVRRLEGGQQVPGVDLSGFGVLQQMGLTKVITQNGVKQEVVSENAADVRRILNRLLALDPDIQQKVFEYYHNIFEAAVAQAIEAGTLDTGVKELQGERIEINEKRVLSADPDTGAETHYYRVTQHEKAPVASIEDLEKAMKRHPEGTFYVNSNTMNVTFAWDADPIVGANGAVREAVYGMRPSDKNAKKADKPAVSDRSIVVDLDTLIERKVKQAESELRSAENELKWAQTAFHGRSEAAIAAREKAVQIAKETLDITKAREADRLGWVKELWQKQFDDTPKTNATEHHLIGGAVLRWWTTVKANQGIRLARDSQSGDRVVGAVIPANRIQEVLARIAGGRVQVSPSQVITDVLRNGTEYQLERGVRIRRGRVSRDQVVQFTVPDQQTGRVLMDLGVIYEKGIAPVYYLPNSQTATQIMSSVLAQFPVDNGRESQREAGNADVVFGAFEAEERAPEVPVSISAVRQLVGPEMRKEDFDRAVLALADRGDVYLTKADAALMESEQYRRTAYVFDAANQTYYTAMTRRTDGRRPEGGFLTITRADLDAIRKPFDVLLGSMGARIADLDAQYGTRLREMIAKSRNNGDVLAGTFLNRLTDAGLAKLYREERMKLLDLLEGRATRAPQKVVDSYRVIRQVTDTVSQLAEAAGLGKTTSYFPHVYRRVEELASGPIRKDVIANLQRIKASPDERHATKFLEHYLTFKRGGKIHSSLSQWVIRQGQAVTTAHAEDLIREGVAGLPFYDPDPGRVLPHNMALMGEKIAQAAVFGADGKFLKSQLEVLTQDAGKDTAEQVAGWMKRILNPREADTKENAILRTIRAAMTWKLGLAFIPNATQAILNIPMKGGLRDGIPVLLSGIRALFSEKGRRFAIESGAAIDPVLAEAHQDLGGGRMGRFADAYMTPMQVVEQGNRIMGAAAGASLAQRLLERSKGNPLKSKSVRTARKRLKELGVDVPKALHSGALTRYDLQMAGKVFSDVTQFRSRAEMLPAWASTPMGKVAAQFKTFAYQQARFLIDTTIGELREGRPGNATFALLWAAVVGAGLGELVRLLRNLISGRQDDPQGWERYAKNLASAGAAGMMLDVVESIERKDASRLAPPAAGTAADLVKLMGAWLDGDGPEATKKFLYRHAPAGALAKGAIEQ